MRINVLNIHPPISQLNYSVKTKNQSNLKFSNKVCNYQPAYYSFVSFKGNKKSELSLVKNIVDSIENEQIPIINTGSSDIVPEAHTDQFSIKNEQHKQILLNKEIELTQQFVDNTSGLFNNPQSTNKEKLKAVQTAYSFVQDKSKKYKEPENLAEYLNSLNLSLDNQHTIFADKSIQHLFQEAQSYWKQEYLPQLLNRENNKITYFENVLEKMPSLKEMKAFNDLSYNDKYFVAKYFEINNFKVFEDDPMKKILTDHTIENKNELLNEVRQKIVIDTEVFNEKLNELPYLLQDESGLEELSNYVINGKNKDDNISLLNLLLISLDKKDVIDKDINIKAEYFANLDSSILDKGIEKVRKIWFLKYIPLKLEKEISYQAYKTDIHVKNHTELSKINAQLEKINIKLDKIAISLTDFISNLDGIYAKFKTPVEDSLEIQRNTGMQIEEMLSSVNRLSDEEKDKLMNSFKTDGIKYLDILLKNTKEQAVANMINDLKKVIVEEKKPNMVLARLESYGTMAVMSNLMHSGHAASAAASHSINTLANADFLSGNTASTVGGGIGAILDPHALAFAAIVAGIYSIYSASQTHKEFSDMYFGGKV